MYTQAYRLGTEARDRGITDMRELMDAYWADVQAYNHTALVFAEAGLRGAPMPHLVTGWRYGAIPEAGLSYNYRDGTPEAGVSVMALDNGDSTQDRLSALFIADSRPVVRVRGYLHTFRRGADGEPLLLDPVAL